MYQILALIIGDRRALNNAIDIKVYLNKLLKKTQSVCR